VIAPLAPNPSDTRRIHYLDNLRALAMFAGVLFHAALAYSPMMQNFWPTSDAASEVGRTIWIDLIAWFVHLFRMPLFFVLAGFFAAKLLQTRGMSGMLHQRAKRVLLPLLLFLPLLYFAMEALMRRALEQVQHPSPLMLLIKQWLSQPSPALPPSLMHLWFLYYLMCFCLLIWVTATLEFSCVAQRFANARLRSIVVGAPLLLLPALLSVSAPTPAPESFLPQWWALLYFGGYFFLGFQLHQRHAFISELKAIAPWLLAGAISAYGAFFWLLCQDYPQQISAPAYWLLGTLQAYAGFWMTLWCLHAGHSWLNRRNRVFSYLARTSYWVYLVHLPILFAIQYQLLDLTMAWPWKFTFSVLGTCLLAFASYEVLVRRTPLGSVV
jgi:glucans biosynthesis protein C